MSDDGTKMPTTDSMAGAPETEVTTEMMAAGQAALSRRYFDLCDGDEYPQIARTVFLAMLALQPGRAPKGDQSH